MPNLLISLAGTTRLELATSGVTGQRAISEALINRMVDEGFVAICPLKTPF